MKLDLCQKANFSFELEGRVYSFECLPRGCVTWRHHCGLLFQPFVSILHQEMPQVSFEHFEDEILICAPTPSLCSEASTTTFAMAAKFGIALDSSGSQLSP